MTSSFAPVPLGNRATLRLPKNQGEKPVWFAYLFGFIAVCVLFLIGHSLLALSFALILPGAILCVRPPKNGLGKLFDYGVLGFLGCILFAFLPQFYWPTASWRIQAVTDYGIDLPRQLSVHPWISLEATILVVAGICWFYVALGWQVNAQGRKYFYFVVSLAMSAFAGSVIWLNYRMRLFVSGEPHSFGMAVDPAQLGSLLALGGVVSFGYAIEGLRVRNLMHVFGLVCSALCMIALVMSECAIGVLVYVLGVSLWYFIRLRSKALPMYFKVAFPFVVSALCLFLYQSDQASLRANEAAERLLVYQDSTKMFLDAPILGNGIHTFASVFPQYREQSRSPEIVKDAGSDVLSILTELGILGFACIVIFLWGYFKQCRGLSLGRGGAFRVIAMVAVIAFLLYTLVDVPVHRPATTYFALLLAAFALPKRVSTLPTLKPILWRFIGLILILFGSAWGVAGLTSAPFHSSTAFTHLDKSALDHADAADYASAIGSVDEILAWNPTLWYAYYQRAEFGFELKSDVLLVEEDFKRARFVEPTLGAFCIDEGFAWLPRDFERAIWAWQEALSRELPDREQAYASMLEACQEDPILMNAMLALSKMNLENRTMVFRYLEASLFNQEIDRELLANPALEQFTPEQRFTIIQNWIQHGDLDKITAFLDVYGEGVQHAWWLQSLLLKEHADFDEAVQCIREGIVAPSLPEVDFETAVLIRIAREFSVAPDNVSKGTRLLSVYLSEGNLQLGLEVADAMLEMEETPTHIYYWRGEILFRMNDIIESWYSFRDYALQEYSIDSLEVEE